MTRVCSQAVSVSNTRTFGEADGEGEVPEAWGYAAAEFADRARGGGSRRLQSHWAAFWGKAR